MLLLDSSKKPIMLILLSRCIALVSMLLLCAAAGADTLRIPEAGAADAGTPQRGMSMQQVEARFGAPETRHQQVGGGHPRRPPITRWDYPGFSVVFERQRVINTVRRDAETPPERNQEALTIRSEPLPAAD